MRRFLALVAVGALMLVFTGCDLGAEIKVNQDGSGRFGFSMLMTKADLETFSRLGGGKPVDPIGQMSKSFKNSAVPLEVETFDKDGGRGVRGTVKFKDAADLREKLKLMNEKKGSAPLGGSGSFKDFTLEKTSTGWHFDSQTEKPAVPGANSSPGAPNAAGDIGDLLTKSLHIAFVVALPGTKKSTNADETSAADGITTFTWRPDIKNPKASHLVADTTFGGGGSSFPVLPVAIGGAIALGALGAGVMASKRKNLAVANAPAVTVGEPVYTPPPAAASEVAPTPTASEMYETPPVTPETHMAPPAPQETHVSPPAPDEPLPPHQGPPTDLDG